MSQRTIKEYPDFKIYQTIIGGDQAFITASVINETKDCTALVQNIYDAILSDLCENGYQIVHERLFAHSQYYSPIIDTRNELIAKYFSDTEMPFTFIYLNPIFGDSLAGIQIRAIKVKGENKVWPVKENGRVVGKGWSRQGADYLMLQNMHGNIELDTRYDQTCDMFQRVKSIIENYDATFQNVARTWIYLDDILDWYDVFNKARNAKFTEFGILGNGAAKAIEEEQIFLPASTGILGANPQSAFGTMDVFVILPSSTSVTMKHVSGLKQKSPFRYGSAFSRAMTMKEPNVSHILLSGTASIDESGKTVYLNDSYKQIEKTFQVVQALIANENATFADITEATVFFKSARDYQHYEKIIKTMDIADLPMVLVEADVCRDDLLFEIDAAISYE